MYSHHIWLILIILHNMIRTLDPDLTQNSHHIWLIHSHHIWLILIRLHNQIRAHDPALAHYDIILSHTIWLMHSHHIWLILHNQVRTCDPGQSKSNNRSIRGTQKHHGRKLYIDLTAGHWNTLGRLYIACDLWFIINIHMTSSWHHCDITISHNQSQSKNRPSHGTHNHQGQILLIDIWLVIMMTHPWHHYDIADDITMTSRESHHLSYIWNLLIKAPRVIHHLSYVLNLLIHARRVTMTSF